MMYKHALRGSLLPLKEAQMNKTSKGESNTATLIAGEAETEQEKCRKAENTTCNTCMLCLEIQRYFSS